jgi:hypothetical protein
LNPANEPAKPLRDAQPGGSLFVRNPLIFNGGKNNRKIITIFLAEAKRFGFITCISKPLTTPTEKMKTQTIKDLLEEQSELQLGKPGDWGYSQEEYDEALENIANELEELGA